MATQWYVSSVLWSALAQWSALQTVALGAVRRQLTGTSASNECAYICTTAGITGASEPGWNTSNNGTTSDGTVVWTNVTGQSATAWATPAGTLGTLSSGDTINNRINANDVIFIDQTHNETGAGSNNTAFINNFNAVYSVNASGAVPPGAADYLPGASITYASGQRCGNMGNVAAYYGVNFTFVTCIAFCMQPSSNAQGQTTFKDCTLTCQSGTGYFFTPGYGSTILDNVTFDPGTGPVGIIVMNGNSLSAFFKWKNKSSVAAFVNNIPPIVYSASTISQGMVWLEGLDLSSITGYVFPEAGCPFLVAKMVNCKLPSSLSEVFAPPSAGHMGIQLEMFNCSSANTAYDNTFISAFGTVTTDQTNYLVGGTEYGTTPVSHKISSFDTTTLQTTGLNVTLDGFEIVQQVSTAGTAVTATVQLCSDTASLTQSGVWLSLDYPGASGSTLGGQATTVTPLANAALSAGTGTWASPPGSPHYYSLSVTFTPQQTGLVRARVRVAAPNINLWYDPTLGGVS